jgi:hypothetical protein
MTGMTGKHDPETAAEFLRSRATWLRVEAVDRDRGGWDVVLVIDGTYSSHVEKTEMVHYFQRWLLEVILAEGIPPHELHAWRRRRAPAEEHGAA